MYEEAALKKVIRQLMTQVEEERCLRLELIKFLINGEFLPLSAIHISDKDVDNRIQEILKE